MILVADGVSCTEILESDSGADVSGLDELDRILMVGVHLVQAADALTLTAAGIKYIRTGIELTRINAHEAQTADERIGSDLERQSRERLVVIGATLIWLGAAVWLYDSGQTGWAIFMVLWGALAVSSVDNFLKPFLISRTASLPILLIALGAFGGVLAFGFIGLFLGPTFLALGQALFAAWTAITPAADEADSTEGLA